MNSRAIAGEYRMAHWAGIIRERKESGLSVKAFCENTGINKNRYYYWQKKLRVATFEEMRKAQGETTSMAQVSFTEVKVLEHSAHPASVAPNQSQVSVETMGGRIVADGGYPTEKLVALLREMRSHP